MQPVSHPQPAIAGVELEVVKIMELWGEGEGKVVARVVIHHLQPNHAEPEPGGRNRTAHQDYSRTDRHLFSDNMFNRMGVSRCRSYGSSPLMVNFVYVLVNEAVVQEAVTVVEPDVMTDHGYQNIKESFGKGR